MIVLPAFVQCARSVGSLLLLGQGGDKQPVLLSW